MYSSSSEESFIDLTGEETGDDSDAESTTSSEMSKVYRIMWGKFGRTRAYPCITISPTDVKKAQAKPSHVWVMWLEGHYNKHRISEIHENNLQPFIPNYKIFSKGISGKLKKGLMEAVQLCAEYSGVQDLCQKALKKYAENGFRGFRNQGESLKDYVEDRLSTSMSRKQIRDNIDRECSVHPDTRSCSIPVEIDSSGSEEMSSSQEVSWISRFCGLNEFFVEVDKDFIKHPSITRIVHEQIPHFERALKVLLDYETDEEIELEARKLYGLIHALYINTDRGIPKLIEKHRNGIYGACPNVSCKYQRMFPKGSEKESVVKLYCPRCEEEYHPELLHHMVATPGSYFGIEYINDAVNASRIRNHVPGQDFQ